MADPRSERTHRRNGNRNPNNTNNNGGGGMRFGRGILGWILFGTLCIALFLMLSRNTGTAVELPVSDVLRQLHAENVQHLTAEGDQWKGEFRNPIPFPGHQGPVKKFRTEVAPGSRLFDQIALNPHNADIKAENSQNFLMTILIPLIPWLLVFGFIWFFVFRQLRNSASGAGMLGNFGRSRHKITSKEHTNVTFEDVAGIEEAKEEVMEIVEFLKNPKRFQRLGGRIPRGVLLVGDPGTGKTLLAKAIAGEADVPFFSISGSDFVEMFVGVGASRVRDLFKQAKDNSPCIIFLDEIDAVGRRRGSGFSSGGHDEREQTLNAILVEMDGFETNDQVIVCAATNRVDVLDPALTRPGRFDRQIHVPLPDVKGRLEILKVHSRKVKLGPNVDLAKLAKATPGFSGADLAACINESALHATMGNKEFIEMDDLEEARDKVRWGRARKSRAIDEKDKMATAYHEAGHAVVQYLLRPDSDPIHKVTIIPRGNYGGATMSLPEKDRNNVSRRWCVAMMKTCFGGRIAEEMFCGDVNTGAMGDIRQATGVARRMIREWGMNDRLGFIFYGEDDGRPTLPGDFGGGREYSEDTAKVIDEEIKKLIDTLYEETRQLLEQNRDRVEAIARALMKYETLDGQDIDRLMRGDTLTRPTVGDLLEKEQGKRSTIIQPGPTDDAPDVNPGGFGLPAPG
jgi:cell division protease FtsH